MATTLRIMLTAAGANVATATIVLQSGVWLQPKPGSQRVDTQANVPLAGTVIPSTNAVLDKRIINGFDMPRCVAIDSTYIYVPVVLSNSAPRYIRIPITSTSYTSGNMAVPIVTDIDTTNWQGYQGAI